MILKLILKYKEIMKINYCYIYKRMGYYEILIDLFNIFEIFLRYSPLKYSLKFENIIIINI